MEKEKAIVGNMKKDAPNQEIVCILGEFEPKMSCYLPKYLGHTLQA